MFNIVFVNYPYVDIDYHYPIGLMNLKTIIEKSVKNINVDIIDFNSLILDGLLTIDDFDPSKSYDRIINLLEDYNPDFIGFSTIAYSYHLTLDIAKFFKRQNGNVFTFLGGPQASVTWFETLACCHWIDFICLGEAEKYIVKLMNFLINKNNISEIENIVTRETPKNYVVTKSDYDIDELPLLDLSTIKNKINIIELEIGRGCPYNCTYCSTSYYWNRKFRVKSPEKLINEIKYYIETTNIRKFNFMHDLFTMNKNYVMKVCQAIIKCNLNIKWGCSSRVDTLDEEMIVAMKAAGCSDMFVGIETGSKLMQKIIKKNLNLDQVCHNLHILVENKIQVRASFIFAFPDETDEQLIDTINYITMLKYKFNIYVILNRCEFYSKTEMYEDNKAQVKYFLGSDEAMYAKVPTDLMLQAPQLFTCFYNSVPVMKYRKFEVFMNYYVNLLDYLFPNTMRYLSTIKHFLDLYQDFIKLDNLLNPIYENTQKYQLKNIEFIKELSLCFNDYITQFRDKTLLFNYQFDMEFFSAKISSFNSL